MGTVPRETTLSQPQSADIDGFSLHMAVRVEAHDRKRLQQLCRCITRLALSDERLQLNNAVGQVVLRLKTAWQGGTGSNSDASMRLLRICRAAAKTFRQSCMVTAPWRRYGHRWATENGAAQSGCCYFRRSVE